MPQEKPDFQHVYHQYVIRHAERNALQECFCRRGIETQIHYPKPVYKQTFLDKSIGGNLTVTKRSCDEMLYLPILPFLDERETSDIVTAINECAE